MQDAVATTGKALKILVVEDDQFLQKILTTKLSRDGFDVRAAFDGEEALKAIAADPPDIVLLDLILPKMNGFEVLSDLKRNPATKKIPVIVLSNLAQEEDIQRVKSLGAADFMVKVNYSIHEVVQRIKEVSAKAAG